MYERGGVTGTPVGHIQENPIPMLWAVLACVAILPTTGNYWNHLELLGFSWMCPTPSTWNVWLLWCAGPPPFHTFYSHALGCAGMRCHSPYYWKLLEPPGTPRILLDVPHPQYLNVWMHWCAGPPPFHTFYSHALGCVGMRCHSPYYWKLLEPPGTPRILLDVPTPSTWNVWLHWCAGPPPFHTFYSHALGCHSPYYWKLLEPPTLGFSWMCPAPRYLKCMAALMCRSPPFKHDKQKTRSWCWGVDSQGRRILRTMGWWRKVNLCSTLWVRLLKASDTIRLWNSMFDKKQKLKELYGMGRVGLDQHTSTIFNPRLNLKKTSFRYRAILKNVRKRHPNNR